MSKVNEKAYLERRNAILQELEQLLEQCGQENRAFNQEQQEKYSQLMEEIRGIDAVLDAEEEMRSMQQREKPQPVDGKQGAEVEERAFAAFIRGTVSLEEQRATNMTSTDNGVIVPKTIANRIIETMKEKAPILSLASVFYTKGELVFPVWDESSGTMTAAYADEFTALTSSSGKFKSVTLKGFLAGVLTKVSISLVNNTDIDLLGYVVTKVAEAAADFLRKEMIVGTPSKMTGLLNTEKLVTAAGTDAITADEIIELEFMLPEAVKGNARWLMNKNTLKAIHKLKDGNDRYLMTEDLTSPSGYVLRGKPVMVDDNMPEMASGKVAMIFADFSGLYVKMVERPAVQVLREKYADEHAIGVISWMEADSKIVEPQKIAGLKMSGG